MTDDKESSAEGAQAGRRRPPPPTIELMATEVSGASVAGGATSSTESPIAGAAEAAGGPRADAAQAGSPYSTRAFIAPAPLLTAGVTGAMAALLVFGALWAAGLIGESGSQAALAGRLTGVETQLRELAGRVQASAAVQAVDDLGQRLSKLEATLAHPPSPPGPDTAAASRLPALEASVKSLAATVQQFAQQNAERAQVAAPELGPLEERLAALETAVKTLRDETANGPANERPLRLAVLALALRSAVERGEPYQAALAAIRPLVPDPNVLKPLEVFAASGVPSRAVLGRELAVLMPEIRRTARPPSQGDGFLARLQANAERLVRVRPLEEIAGDEPTTVIARLEAKAAREDLAGALAESSKLPPHLRALLEPWVARAQARIAATDAAERVVRDALVALGTGAGKGAGER